MPARSPPARAWVLTSSSTPPVNGRALASDGASAHARYRDLLSSRSGGKRSFHPRKSVQATARRFVEDLVSRGKLRRGHRPGQGAAALGGAGSDRLAGRRPDNLLTWASATLDALRPTNERTERPCLR